MKERVLLVEDEPSLCEVLSLALKIHGFEAIATGTVAAARQELERGPFVAALIDKNLPDGSGVDFLVEARRKAPDTAFLIMTGYSSFETAVSAMRSGASDYLVKPFPTLDEVMLRMRRAIDGLRRERERVVFEAERDQARSELSAIFDAAAEPILILELDGRLRRANAAAANVYADVGPGSRLADPNDPEELEAIRRAAAGEVVRREQVVRRTRAGSERMAATLAPIRGRDGIVTALVETTISVEETLRTQRALHQVDKMTTLGALAATLVHELANPVGCARNYVDLLFEAEERRGQVNFSPADIRDMLGEMRKTLDVCCEVIRRTREFAAPQPATSASVSVELLVRDAVRFVGPALTQQAKVAQDVPPDLTIAGDRVGLVQVLVNLLANAAHALRGRPSPKVELFACADGGELRLAVRDNGCGIPAAELPRIWERFFTTKPAAEGTGLGLAVCRDIVRAHGGSIAVESRPGEGTCFEIRLPLEGAAAPAVDEPERSPRAPALASALFA